MEIRRDVLELLQEGIIKLDDFKYKRFVVVAKAYYTGKHYIYAEDLEEAKKIIQSYKEFDTENRKDTWGFGTIFESNTHFSAYKSQIYDTKEDFFAYFNNDITYTG
ncbi:MAG: hypothetical protein ACRCRT_05350 [Cetobacterium somerae]